MKKKNITTPGQREQIRVLVASGLTSKAVGAEIGFDRNAICKIVLEYDLGPWNTSARSDQSPAPADFAEKWEVMPRAVLVKHYGVSQGVITRWVKQSGLKRDRGINIGRGRKVQKEKRANIKPFIMHGGHKPTEIVIHRDMSSVGLAVEFLRSLSPVSRCRADGMLDPKGSYWRRGSAVFNNEQVVERADEIRARAERMAA